LKQTIDGFMSAVEFLNYLQHGAQLRDRKVHANDDGQQQQRPHHERQQIQRLCKD
jgi:hypothetical protein